MAQKSCKRRRPKASSSTAISRECSTHICFFGPQVCSNPPRCSPTPAPLGAAWKARPPRPAASDANLVEVSLFVMARRADYSLTEERARGSKSVVLQSITKHRPQSDVSGEATGAEEACDSGMWAAGRRKRRREGSERDRFVDENSRGILQAMNA